MDAPGLASRLDAAALVAWYRRNRARSRALFDLLTDEAYYARPIALRHPVVFYEGHLAAFSFNTLVKRGLGCPSIDEVLERLFARGIDPEADVATEGVRDVWPDRKTVLEFSAEADRHVLAALDRANFDRPGHPLLDRGEAAFAILEHEAMHQETLLYMFHRLPFAHKKRPAVKAAPVHASVPAHEWIEIPAGLATLGVNADACRFAWDNERPSLTTRVPAFAIERHDVTNAAFMTFVESGGYEDERWWSAKDWAWLRSERLRHPLFWERVQGAWHWRGMFALIPLPLSWPVYVSHAEASAYARWSGTRLPTEAEFQRAAFGSPDDQESPYPWGSAAATSDRGVFDFSSWDPEPVGSRPAGRSAWGVDDLVGNGWEWTSTVFAGFPGFQPMASYPEYSADFFDGEHVVMKGASPATARELLRPSFRNWFRPRYPYVYATFRCARGPA